MENSADKGPPDKRKREPNGSGEQLGNREFQWLMEAINQNGERLKELKDDLTKRIDRFEDKIEGEIKDIDTKLDGARKYIHIGLGIILGIQSIVMLFVVFLK